MSCAPDQSRFMATVETLTTDDDVEYINEIQVGITR